MMEEMILQLGLLKKLLNFRKKIKMGMFSWITQDTKRSICTQCSSRDTFKVYMLDNKGNKWTEESYEGYGVFGGKDYFELLAEMNGLITREEGIKLQYSDNTFISPNLVESDVHKWTNEVPEDCPDQGFIYDDDLGW